MRWSEDVRRADAGGEVFANLAMTVKVTTAPWSTQTLSAMYLTLEMSVIIVTAAAVVSMLEATQAKLQTMTVTGIACVRVF